MPVAPASAPRRVPFLAWEPVPFAAALVCVIAASAVRPERTPWWVFWPVMAVAAAAVVWLLVSVLRGTGGAANRWGELSSLDGIRLVGAPPPAREVPSRAPVDEVHRHQGAIAIAVIHAGHAQRAVLVPRARHWFGRRYRIAVQLKGDGTPRHAGFLKPAADDRWRDLLDGLYAEGAFVEVPATISGTVRRYTVDLDLGGLPALEAGRRA